LIKPSSSMVHREDGGWVYSSIQNDGTIIHWCDKCERMWISKEQSESEVPKSIFSEKQIEKFRVAIKTAVKLASGLQAVRTLKI